jgi:hypothetical protein
VADVVAGARRHLARVVVVDDGSGDETGRAPRPPGGGRRARDERREGAALATGLRVLARGVGRALTLDADGQHLPARSSTLLAASTPTDGDRRRRAEEGGHTIRTINRVGNWIADRLLHAIAGQPLPTRSRVSHLPGHGDAGAERPWRPLRLRDGGPAAGGAARIGSSACRSRSTIRPWPSG